MPAVVEATATGNSNGAVTDHVIPLPAGSQSGDLIVIWHVAAASGPTWTWPSGWSNQISNTNTIRMQMRYKVLDGSEGSSITITASSAVRGAWIVYRISGATTGTTGTVASGTSAVPDPGSTNPIGVKYYLFLTCCAYADGTTTSSDGPTDFSNLLNEADGNSSGVGIASADRFKFTNALDADAFTISASELWLAATFAVTPTTDLSPAVNNFSFNSGLEDWAFTQNGASNIAGTRDTTEDAPNDSNAGTGVLQTRRTAKNQSDGTPYWEWAGTWEDLGVPAGATVVGVNIAYDWRCSEYTTGANTSATGPAELRDGSGNLRKTASAALTFGATSNFATRAGTVQGDLEDASDTSIRLRLGAKPNTGNSSSAAVTLRQDWITVSVYYLEDNEILLAGTSALAITSTAALTTEIQMAGTSAAAITSTAALTTEIRMAAAVTAAVSTAGALTTDITMAAAATVAVSATADLQAPQQSLFEASVTLAVAAQAALETEIRIAGAADVAVAATGALTTEIAMAGTAAAALSTAAAMTTEITMAGASTAAVTTAGVFTTEITMAVTAALAIAAAADLEAPGQNMVGTATLAIAASAALTTEITMAGTAAAAVASTAALSTEIALAGTASAAVSTAGALTTEITMAAAASLNVTGAGDLATEIRMAGTAALALNATGGLATEIRMAGTVQLAIAAAGELTVPASTILVAFASLTSTSKVALASAVAAPKTTIVSAAASLKTSFTSIDTEEGE